MTRSLVWFQRNLRFADNPALTWALQRTRQSGGEIILLYVHSPLDEIPWQRGAASCWWLLQSLASLKQNLAQQGLILNFIDGSASDIIPKLVSRQQIDAVSWQCNYEPHLSHRDQQIAEQLVQIGAQVEIFDDGLLPNPNALKTQKGTPYRVFTPFYNKLRGMLSDQTTQVLPASQTANVNSIRLFDSVTLEDLHILKPHPWQSKLANYHQPGEQTAQKKLYEFLDDRLSEYSEQRDIPALDATSHLSAHLHFGEISAQQILSALMPLIHDGTARQAAAAEAFLRQLIWREFARYILWHFPTTPEQSMDKRFDEHFWHFDEQRLQSWQRGETGVAIIDAGMRQLWQSGTMHNRVRMLTASYLSKNLDQPWQLGARWFWDTLVDADLANNSMGWQWVAGCGVDAAPYFRIFNPDTQASKFDPDGLYRQHWLSDRHSPNKTVDLSADRRRALQRYQQHIKRSH